MIGHPTVAARSPALKGRGLVAFGHPLSGDSQNGRFGKPSQPHGGERGDRGQAGFAGHGFLKKTAESRTTTAINWMDPEGSKTG